MHALNFELLLRILVAHFLSDFIFQQTSWAKKKDESGIKSGYFWLHIVITMLTLSVLLWDWQVWPVIVWVTLGHFIIDAIKNKLSHSVIWIFIADQFLHLLIIVMVWLVYSHQMQLFCDAITESINNQKFWWLLLAYITLSIPSSVLIGKMTKKWSNELEDPKENEKKEGLENAGKWIGILERLLILTFIIANEFSAIGFLLAAKSVFRFGDLKNASEHKKTEYIIIGTFLSFSIAITTGLIYKYAIQ
jgi:hypothetical protein